VTERLGEWVRRELSQYGPAAGMAEVVSAWPAAVGEPIARRAWPARIARDGTLHVHAADSVWAFELGQRAEEIAARLGVAAVRFAPGPLPEADPEEAGEGPPAPPEPTAEERERAATLVAGIGDEELRALVARAAAASLARAAAGRSV
jgi:hypothetical protein